MASFDWLPQYLPRLASETRSIILSGIWVSFRNLDCCARSWVIRFLSSTALPLLRLSAFRGCAIGALRQRDLFEENFGRLSRWERFIAFWIFSGLRNATTLLQNTSGFLRIYLI